MANPNELTPMEVLDERWEAVLAARKESEPATLVLALDELSTATQGAARAIAAEQGYPADIIQNLFDLSHMPEIIMPGAVAKLFGVDPKTITRWCRQGRLQAIKTRGGHRRFHRDYIAKVLAGSVEMYPE